MGPKAVGLGLAGNTILIFFFFELCIMKFRLKGVEKIFIVKMKFLDNESKKKIRSIQTNQRRNIADIEI